MARSMIDVSVSRRVLWVGGDAYPLGNIARARQFMVVPRRSFAIRRFLRALGSLFALLLAISFVSEAQKNDSVKAVGGWVVIALFALSVYRLVQRLRMKPLYKLIIETSSSSNTAVVSHDSAEVSTLIRLIMDAIDNPQAEFALQVENIHIGDRINQYGDHNTGKMVHS
ncbi:DUF6232 family protein [Kitasatospora sp. NPDC028055]|uniref:DUF6232 family protein n=1 Tax=Kitasatospora sp. NPDC028055 TaxID=3155653 RepID=UPI00340D220C